MFYLPGSLSEQGDKDRSRVESDQGRGMAFSRGNGSEERWWWMTTETWLGCLVKMNCDLGVSTLLKEIDFL